MEGVSVASRTVIPANVNGPALPSAPQNLSPTIKELPDIIRRAGANAVFAAQEFFFGTIRNEHTRRAYLHAAKQFLAWAGKHCGGELVQIALARRQIL